jgi:hypothetical protein
MTLVYAIIMMTMLCGFVSLGVDFGRVQMAKTQMERAAFAASRAGAAGLADGTASAKAIQFAAANMVDGTPLVLQPADVVVGTWAAGSFSPGGASPNAVQINAYRTAARGTAIPLVFGQVIGRSSCDIKCIGVVATAASSPTGFTGLNSFPVHKKVFCASYDSGVTTSPSHSTYNSNSLMQTNGVLCQGATAGAHLYGNAKVGPSGSVAGGVTISGTTTTLGSNITATAVTMTVVTNPGGVSQTPNVGSNVTWPGGTYYFTSLTVQGGNTINFSGSATIYMNGNATMQDGSAIVAHSSIPGNLVFYQASGNTFTAGNSDTFIGVYNGPGADVSFNDNALIEGAMMAKSITMHDNDDLYFDEELASIPLSIGTGH